MSPKPAIISVLGSLNVDLVTRTTRIPAAGETLTSSSFAIGYGGKGANQAVACARLSRTKQQAQFQAQTQNSPPAEQARDSNEGTEEEAPNVDVDVGVHMHGALGSDEFSSGFLDSLKADGVQTSGVRVVQGVKTGVAVILVEESSGENRILVSPGANGTLQTSDGYLIAPEATVALFQLELPLDVVLWNLKRAKEKGVETILNPAPAVPLPEEVWRGLGHLVVNETEAEMLSGIQKPRDWNEVAAMFIKKGVENVIVTLGGEGVFYQTSTHPGTLIPALKVPVVDTTAAGDTFVGAYSVAVARWKARSQTRGKEFDLPAAIAHANRAASLTVQREGAQSSIPWVDEVPER